MMQSTMAARGRTGTIDVFIAVGKLAGDLLYLTPMMLTWAEHLRRRRDRTTWFKGIYTIVLCFINNAVDVNFIAWTVFQ